jgi:mannobiose 2-epimerase
MDGFKQELTENILPFWMDKMQDKEYGGFYGRIDGYNKLHKNATKGAILNARLLWTFSAAYRVLKDEQYLETAQRAFDYITTFFLDKRHEGAYWELDYQGYPVNTKKQVYAQSFMLYGFSEFYRATGNKQALELAKRFFFLIEKCRDKKREGYFEAYTGNWQPIEDMRLSDKDANEKKTMNTHLHILESYTNLYRIWPNKRLAKALTRLINIFTEQILNPVTNHLQLFFDEEWQIKSSVVSYGHDIEASWLLSEATETLNDDELTEKVRIISLKIADAASEGLEAGGSMIYEKDVEQSNKERHWWVQAEAVVGFMHAYRKSGNSSYREKAEKTWNYIRNQIVDHIDKEWIWSRLEDNMVNHKEDKAGFWKCPYHNGRMCLEMIEHFSIVCR